MHACIPLALLKYGIECTVANLDCESPCEWVSYLWVTSVEAHTKYGSNTVPLSSLHQHVRDAFLSNIQSRK